VVLVGAQVGWAGALGTAGVWVRGVGVERVGVRRL